MPQKHYTIDIRSDTVSTPTKEMRQAMYEAVVGDDVYGEDPTVRKLEEKSAELFGKEAGLFCPSGTMCNLLAIMVHCNRRGTEAIVGDLSHTFLYEQGGAAHIAGVQLATIKNKPDGTFCLSELKRKIRSDDYHEPITALVIVENTHNMCGGKILPLEWLDRLSLICRQHSAEAGSGGTGSRIALHMDGARVFNAAVAMGTTVERITRDFDSVCFCLSKGLSAPVGSMLVGSKDFINEARRVRKALGGGMRQAGILAAAGLIALGVGVEAITEHHRKTRLLAQAIHKLQSPNIQVDIDNVQTNILLIHISNKNLTASEFADRLKCVTDKELDAGIIADKTNPNRGIILKASSRDWEFARVVLYHQITDQDIELAIKKLSYVIREYDSKLTH